MRKLQHHRTGATAPKKKKKVLALPTDTSAALDEVLAAYESLRSEVDGCPAGALLAPLLDDYDVDSFAEGVQSEIQDLDEESLNELAGDVSRVG